MLTQPKLLCCKILQNDKWIILLFFVLFHFLYKDITTNKTKKVWTFTIITKQKYQYALNLNTQITKKNII
jgi:hypothetical protein